MSWLLAKRSRSPKLAVWPMFARSAGGTSEAREEVSVVMPAYREVHRAGMPIKPTGIELTIPIGRKTVPARLLQCNFAR